ncbi:MAG: helix-turn-helix domain-containing protein [Pseudomonadota bacterium]
MRSSPKFSFNEIESPHAPDQGPYDAGSVDADDLWFLPPPDHAALDEPHDLPGPRADQTPLVDVAAWAAAEGALARPLADLTLQLGLLAARLQAGPAGWGHRLALQEATDLSWLSGDRVPKERLALWLTLRLAGDTDDAQALARAGWAARRLQGGLPPQHDLAAFLGRRAEARDEQLPHQIADWQEVMDAAQGLHPVTQAALSYHLWPVTGLSAAGSVVLPAIEAAVVAARFAVRSLPAAPFLPLALGGAAGLRGGGPPQDRLRRWISGADHATRAALRLLDGLAAWEAQAQVTCADLTGRTPSQLIRLLRDWPLISAPMAETETDASRAAVQRNLNLLVSRGIAREVTGQGRYRFWAAAG